MKVRDVDVRLFTSEIFIIYGVYLKLKVWYSSLLYHVLLDDDRNLHLIYSMFKITLNPVRQH